MNKEKPDVIARIIRDLNIREEAREAREYTYRDPVTGDVRFGKRDVIVEYDRDGRAISYRTP